MLTLITTATRQYYQSKLNKTPEGLNLLNNATKLLKKLKAMVLIIIKY